MGGHKGGLPLGRVMRLVQRTAYKPLHAAFNRVGVARGLPPDVVTVQIGNGPQDGLWWNLKRGVIPENDVRSKAGYVDDSEVLELMDKHGMDPLGRQAIRGSIARHAHAQPLITERMFTKRVPSKLLYIGWRAALISMLENRAIRGSSEVEELLGQRDYRAAMRLRRLRETVHYED